MGAALAIFSNRGVANYPFDSVYSSWPSVADRCTGAAQVAGFYESKAEEPSILCCLSRRMKYF